MKKFNKLIVEGRNYKLTSKRKYKQLYRFKKETIEKVFNFAYDMSFGGKGQHRDHRSGGKKHRKNGEIFINTFQGKLAECCIYNFLFKKVDNLTEPDFETFDLGIWDSFDLELNGKKIAVKSTKFYGNLMLLESKDWTSEAEYKPNLDKGNALYDFFVLIRISGDGEMIMKNNKLLYSDECDREKLHEIICSKNWGGDIPGFITNDNLKNIIKHNYIIPKEAMLGKDTEMDAENYYVQSGDMSEIQDLLKLL